MSTALLTDHYELTMVNAARASNRADRHTVFEVFSRNLPGGRRYGVVAGTARLLDAIGDFHFGDSELDFLSHHSIVGADTLEWLANYHFRGKISGYREGEIYVPGSPILTGKPCIRKPGFLHRDGSEFGCAAGSASATATSAFARACAVGSPPTVEQPLLRARQSLRDPE